MPETMPGPPTILGPDATSQPGARVLAALDLDLLDAARSHRISTVDPPGALELSLWRLLIQDDLFPNHLAFAIP
ncbi:MAG: hypothetical protein M3454_06310 [Actinomycetota bacterium]|nr:hypothetical protein [Actinomycetota bacterium]